jgi:hypothetical protein
MILQLCKKLSTMLHLLVKSSFSTPGDIL